MVYKLLLVAGPRPVMFVLTGSTMAAAWLNIGLMRANGYSLLTTTFQLDLPTSHCQADMEYVWQALCNESPELPQDLLQWAEPTPAMLASLALDWRRPGCPQDLRAYAAVFRQTKLVTEVTALLSLCIPWCLGRACSLSLDAQSLSMAGSQGKNRVYRGRKQCV